MVHYACKCGMVFDKKSGLNNHHKNIKGCSIDPDKPPRPLKIHKCPHEGCGKIMSRGDGLTEHIKTCAKRIKNSTVLVNNAPQTNNGNNCNNLLQGTVNDNRVIINMNMPNRPDRPLLWPFGKICCGLNNLTYGEINTVLDSTENMYVSLFKIVHCNPSKPEYHNIHYIDKNKLLLFINNGWSEKDPTQTMQSFIDNEQDALIDFLEYNQMLLSESRYTKIRDLINSTRSTNKDDLPHIEEVYNERKHIKDTLIETLAKYKTLHAETYNNVKNTCETINRADFQTRQKKTEKLKKRQKDPVSRSDSLKEFYSFNDPTAKAKNISESTSSKSDSDTDSKSYPNVDITPKKTSKPTTKKTSKSTTKKTSKSTIKKTSKPTTKKTSKSTVKGTTKPTIKGKSKSNSIAKTKSISESTSSKDDIDSESFPDLDPNIEFDSTSESISEVDNTPKKKLKTSKPTIKGTSKKKSSKKKSKK